MPLPSQQLERRKTPRRHEDRSLPNFQDMVEGAVQGILIHSNFKPLFVNNAFARLFGYDKPEELLALPLIRPLFPAELWPEIELEYNRFIRGDTSTQISRMMGTGRDGTDIWLSTTKRIIDWHGTPAVQITAFDISKQVAMEQLLLGNEQQLRGILEILPVPIYIARRRDGKLLFVNRKTCLLLQQGAGAMLRSSSEQFFVDQEDRSKIHMMIDSVPDVREIEVKMRTAQGREFMAELAAIRIIYGEQPAMLVSLNDISERKKMEAELFHQANTDSLTGLSNRRYFMIQAEQEIRRAHRFSRALSVIMMDLDHFKHINDTYGHAAGDIALETIVKASLESLRESDIMGRLGGEEFAILLPETSLEAASEVASRLLTNIAQTPIPTGKKVIHCTTSLGVAELRSTDSSIDELLCRADDALFVSKENGRNRATLGQ
ncbi:MAG: sensor domain-containing diguanylate cyclase [Alphaproteobacteria bacterium]|nr:sensor domain-containing diguanylate cyclase [Alphaproteobacteria bacterium]